MFSPAPTHDLTHLTLDPGWRDAMFYRWADRALRELTPRALAELGYPDEGTRWRTLLGGHVGPSTAGIAYDLCRELQSRIWPSGNAPVSQELAFHVLGSAEHPAKEIAELTGHIRTVMTTWDEATGPGEVIPFTDADLAQHAVWRTIEDARAARTIAHTLGGQVAFAQEVAQQYRDLEGVGWHGPREGTEWGGEGGGCHLVGGRRYRVYEVFADGDGRLHPWGESWRFDKFVFDPARCEVLLHLSEGALLDSRLNAIEAVEIRTLRIPWNVGDKPGYAKEPLAYWIATV